jgi:hypothetical protein
MEKPRIRAEKESKPYFRNILISGIPSPTPSTQIISPHPWLKFAPQMICPKSWDMTLS